MGRSPPPRPSGPPGRTAFLGPGDVLLLHAQALLVSRCPCPFARSPPGLPSTPSEHCLSSETPRPATPGPVPARLCPRPLLPAFPRALPTASSLPCSFSAATKSFTCLFTESPRNVKAGSFYSTTGPSLEHSLHREGAHYGVYSVDRFSCCVQEILQLCAALTSGKIGRTSNGLTTNIPPHSAPEDTVPSPSQIVKCPSLWHRTGVVPACP